MGGTVNGRMINELDVNRSVQNMKYCTIVFVEFIVHRHRANLHEQK